MPGWGEAAVWRQGWLRLKSTGRSCRPSSPQISLPAPYVGKRAGLSPQPKLMNGRGREPCVGSPEEPGREQGRQGWQRIAGGLHALAGNRFIFTLGLGARAGQRGKGEVEPV